jgi:hypothetical protein
VVWANLYGGFAIGLDLLDLTLVAEAIEAARAGSFNGVWPLALTMVVSIVACLLTPNGMAGVPYPLAFVPQATGGQQQMPEWQPPDLRQARVCPLWAWMGAPAAAAYYRAFA